MELFPAAFPRRPESEKPYWVRPEILIPGIRTEGMVTNEAIPDIPTPLAFGIELSPSDPDYRTLSKGIATPSQYAMYAEESVHGNPELQTALKQAFEGTTVLDLGAGKFAEAYPLIHESGASGYVGVEKFFAAELFRCIAKISAQSSQPIPYAVIKEDMLDLLRRIPNNSVSVWTSGITDIVIQDQEYRKAITQEIERVLSPQGAYADFGGGGGSNAFHPHTLRKSGYEGRYDTTYIYKKQHEA